MRLHFTHKAKWRVFSFTAYALMLCNVWNARRDRFRELANVFVCCIRIDFVYILFGGCNVHNMLSAQNAWHGEPANILALL